MEDIVKKAQDIIDQKYDEFRKSVIEKRNVRSFAILKDAEKKAESYRALGIEISTKGVRELFSDAEGEQIQKDFFLRGYYDPERREGQSREISYTYEIAQWFIRDLGCKITPEICGEIFCSLMKKDNGYVDSYVYSHLMLGGHHPKVKCFLITAEAAKRLVEWRSRRYWNDELINDKEEVFALIEKTEPIFLTDQDSYRSYVVLRDRIPE